MGHYDCKYCGEYMCLSGCMCKCKIPEPIKDDKQTTCKVCEKAIYVLEKKTNEI